MVSDTNAEHLTNTDLDAVVAGAGKVEGPLKFTLDVLWWNPPTDSWRGRHGTPALWLSRARYSVHK